MLPFLSGRRLLPLFFICDSTVRRKCLIQIDSSQLICTTYVFFLLSNSTVGCASDACMKTGSKSQQCPRDRQEEEAELCSAAVSWQQITGDLKHWVSV